MGLNSCKGTSCGIVVLCVFLRKEVVFCLSINDLILPRVWKSTWVVIFLEPVCPMRWRRDSGILGQVTIVLSSFCSLPCGHLQPVSSEQPLWSGLSWRETGSSVAISTTYPWFITSSSANPQLCASRSSKMFCSEWERENPWVWVALFLSSFWVHQMVMSSLTLVSS